MFFWKKREFQQLKYLLIIKIDFDEKRETFHFNVFLKKARRKLFLESPPKPSLLFFSPRKKAGMRWRLEFFCLHINNLKRKKRSYVLFFRILNQILPKHTERKQTNKRICFIFIYRHLPFPKKKEGRKEGRRYRISKGLLTYIYNFCTSFFPLFLIFLVNFFFWSEFQL